MPKYSVVIKKQARKGLEKLPPAIQAKALKFIDTILRVDPLQRIPRKVKRLKSRKLRGIWQYDLSKGDRLWWRVDEANRIVYVIYIGPHPKETE